MVHFSENSSVRDNFRQNLAETSIVKPLNVEDHEDARALHCRQRAGPGHQHRLAVRVAALLIRPGLQAIELAAKAVTGRTPMRKTRLLAWPRRRQSYRGHRTGACSCCSRWRQRIWASHTARPRLFCLDQPAAAVEPIDACR